MASQSTLNDVARRAGVSAKTVSRVVNGEPNVSEGVRESVGLAIAALGYQPNMAARTLKTARSNIIGVLSPGHDSAYYHMLHAQLSDACRQFGYHLVVERVELGSGNSVAALRRLLDEVRLDGLIISFGAAEFDHLSELEALRNLRTVSISFDAGFPANGTVLANEHDGEVQLANHLWELGHRRIAMLKARNTDRFLRSMAFEKQLLELGADPADLLVIDADLWMPTFEIGRRAALEILESPLRPTALFALTDQVAAGATSAFLTRGVGIPDDISIVAFDDGDMASATWPALTTIRQPIKQMAEHAIAMIANRDGVDRKRFVCPVDLIVRESTGRAPR